jgi:hypothetical protein
MHAVLGAFDQLAIMAVVDNVTSPGSAFKIQIFHSANGRLWLPKSGTIGDAEIGGVLGITLSSGAQVAYFGSDAGTTPSLGLVYLRIDLGNSGSAHVRVHVTGRNRGMDDKSHGRGAPR